MISQNAISKPITTRSGKEQLLEYVGNTKYDQVLLTCFLDVENYSQYKEFANILNSIVKPDAIIAENDYVKNFIG